MNQILTQASTEALSSVVCRAQAGWYAEGGLAVRLLCLRDFVAVDVLQARPVGRSKSSPCTRHRHSTTMADGTAGAGAVAVRARERGVERAAL
jgi:hypothetical protein